MQVNSKNHPTEGKQKFSIWSLKRIDQSLQSNLKNLAQPTQLAKFRLHTTNSKM